MKLRTLGAALIALSCAGMTATAQTKSGGTRAARMPAAPARPRLVVQLGQKSIDSSGFSADSSLVATGSWADGTAVVWDVASGREVRRFSGINEPSGAQDGITAVAFSPDKRSLAVSVNNVVRVFDMITGKLMRTIRRPEGEIVVALAFRADAKALVADATGARVTIDVATGRVLSRIPNDKDSWMSPKVSTPDGRLSFQIVRRDRNDAQSDDTVVFRDAKGNELRREQSQGDRALSISPDGRLAVFGTYDEAQLWDIETFSAIRTFGGFANSVASTGFTADGLFTASAGASKVWLRDVATGSRVEADTGETSAAAVAFSPDHSLFAYDLGTSLVIADAETGAAVRTLPANAEGVYSLAFSPTGRFLTANNGDLTVQVWDVASGKSLATIPGESSVDPNVAFSADDTLAYADWNIYDTATWSKRVALPISDESGLPDLPPAAFSPDGKTILTGRSGPITNIPQLWNVGGRRIRQFRGHDGDVTSIAFSPDGTRVLTGGLDATARVWDTATGRQLVLLAGHEVPVYTVAFSPDGRFAITRSADSVVRLCDVTDGRELCRLVTLANGDWVAVDPEGRFDTNALDGIEGLHWIGPESPFTPLPVEVFMRQFYEPRLFARILAGERFAPVRSVADLNALQPTVKIASVTPGASNTATIVVEVAKAHGVRVRAGASVPIESGVFDLRLFRDGQLVGYAPATSGEVPLDANGTARLTFENVKLPTGEREVAFSAYAFNVDRVKSETSRATLTLDAPLPAARGRAYIVSVGVNAYDDARLNLRFAANDARRLQSLLAGGLAKSNAYADVVPILLTSQDADADTPASRSATKANLHAVLDVLSGQTAERGALADVANADRLRAAGPDDLVVISFSGHGYAAVDGTFYLVPSDVGGVMVAPAIASGEKLLTHEETGPTALAAMLPHCVSNDELALWLRDLDAGQIALVVDACQSAASVESDGFKPGPMGSRGLGQLAYDKGMRVLAATQTDNVALENARLQQGLLTYALTHDGLEAGQADFKPADRIIGLSEWLSYGVRRVPELYREIRVGSVTAFGGEKPRILVHGEPPKHDPVRKTQQPALFDFSRRADAVVSR